MTNEAPKKRIEKIIAIATNRFDADEIATGLHDPENGIHAQKIETGNPMTGEYDGCYFDIRVIFNR
jgi:hypothetical protein